MQLKRLYMLTLMLSTYVAHFINLIFTHNLNLLFPFPFFFQGFICFFFQPLSNRLGNLFIPYNFDLSVLNIRNILYLYFI